MQLCAVFDLAFLSILFLVALLVVVDLVSWFVSFLVVDLVLLRSLLFVCRPRRAACATTGAGGRLAS
jgi:hypothetical protein